MADMVLKIQKRDDGKIVANVSVADYLVQKNRYLQCCDELQISGSLHPDEVPGLFYNDDPTYPSRLVTLDLTDIYPIGKVPSVANLFRGNRLLTTIVGLDMFIKLLRIENTANFSGMFADCAAMRSVDVSDWAPGCALPKDQYKGPESFESMFEGCAALESVMFSKDINGKILSHWCGAKKIAKMFKGCGALPLLDVHMFELNKTSPVEDLYDFAAGCRKLAAIKLPKMVTSYSEIGRDDMFYDCPRLIHLSGGTEKIQLDQDRFYQGCLRNMNGYSFEQARAASTVVLTGELGSLRKV